MSRNLHYVHMQLKSSQPVHRRLARALMLLAALASVAPRGGAAEMKYHHLVEWTGAGRGAHGLGVQFFRGNEGEQVTHILVESPEGDRLALKLRFDVISGRDWYRLQHEASGWWVEAERGWPRSWSSFSAFFESGNADLEAAFRRQEQFTFVLRTVAGPMGEFATPVLPPPEAFESLADELAATESAKRFADELPARVAAAIPFLEAAFNQQSIASQLGPFVRLLRRLAGLPDEAVRSGAWSEDRELKKGVVVTEPEFQRLLERFEGLDPASL